MSNERDGLLAMLFAHEAVGAWTWTPGSNAWTCSPALRRMVGLGPADEVATLEAFRARLHPDDRRAVAQALATALREDAPFAFTARIRRTDGRSCEIQASGTVLGGDGPSPRLVGVCSEVPAGVPAADAASGRPDELVGLDAALRARNDELAAHAEELRAQADALEAHRSLLARVLERVPAGIAVVDHAGIVRRANPELRRMAGVPAATLEGGPVTRLVAKASRAALHRMLARVRRAGGAGTLVDVAGAADPDSCWDMGVVDLPGEEGGPGSVMVVALDNTVRAQELRARDARIAALQEVDRCKDEFLRVVSHELRTPLGAVLGFASILEEEIPGSLNPAQRRAVTQVLQGAERMLRIVDDLLDIARIRAGKLFIEPRPGDFAAMLADVVATFEPQAASAGVALMAEIEALPGLAFDAARMAQVVGNLVANAITFTPAGGRVAVRAARRGGAVVTEVVDTGCGVPAAFADRVFQRFDQLDMSRTRPHGGIGLGLAIARGLVEAHGGAIGVDADDGHGARFWFTLPAPDEVSTRSRSPR